MWREKQEIDEEAGGGRREGEGGRKGGREGGGEGREEGIDRKRGREQKEGKRGDPEWK